MSARVVFVCEHGSGKSLIAREWFDRLARERGLQARSACRGLAPEPAPARIQDRLRADGFEVTGFEPQGLAPGDLVGAARLVMIGSPPPDWAPSAGVSVESWEGIPPASQDYEASRDALRQRIATLLESLADETAAG